MHTPNDYRVSQDEASHTTVNAIEAYCCTLANHLITDSHLNQEIKTGFWSV